MTNSDYELQIEKEVLYALASLCVATYADAGVDRSKIREELIRPQQRFLKFMATIGRMVAFIPRKTFRLFRKPLPAKNVSDLITEDTESEVVGKFKEPFTRLGWKMPSASDITLINHRYLKGDEARLGGFAITTENYIAVAFRGTAYSEEWVANLSYGVPAVKNVRHVAGITTLSVLPFLKRSKFLEKVFDLKTAKFLNAGYLEHVDGMVRQTKEFLDKVMRAEQADPSLKSRPLYFTGHSLGGAAAIIVSREVFEDPKRPYKSWFGSRMITVTFGAPPISGRQVIAQPDDPPVYNLLRPGDIVPSASIDVLGIPLVNKIVGQLPGTPYHRGEHYYIRDNGKQILVRQYPYKRGKVFRSVGAQFLIGTCKLRAFRHTMRCHYMANYAKDLECLVFPMDCRKWKSSKTK